MKKIITLLSVFLLANINYSQVAPTSGKKTLEVKETYKGEYMQKVTNGGLSSVVISAMKKRIPKKLKKYGFNDITITEVGKVNTPVSKATKMSNLAGGNEGAGKAQLQVAKTSNQINAAVDRIYTEESDNDWKFQVNFIDNETKEEFKVRLNMSYNPKYIIKKTDTIINLRD